MLLLLFSKIPRVDKIFSQMFSKLHPAAGIAIDDTPQESADFAGLGNFDEKKFGKVRLISFANS